MLLNLTSNAVKFTEHGEVVLRAQLEDRTDQGVIVRFEVTDTGVGIAADDRDRLFDAFSQADSSTTRKFGGTGLSRPKSAFLANMSHEIPHPHERRASASPTPLLDTPARRTASLRTCRHDPRHRRGSLLAVVNDILDISKIDAGKLELERTTLNIAELIEEVSAPFADPARVKGLELDLMIDPGPDRHCAATPRASARSSPT